MNTGIIYIITTDQVPLTFPLGTKTTHRVASLPLIQSPNSISRSLTNYYNLSAKPSCRGDRPSPRQPQLSVWLREGGVILQGGEIRVHFCFGDKRARLSQ